MIYNKQKQGDSMKKLIIFDTTLRDGEQAPGNSMHSSEKLEMALQLEKLGVDVIEAGFAASSSGDFASLKEIAERIKNCTVCSLSRCKKEDIDLAYNALKNAAKKPRLHLFLSTSPLHMQYKLKMSEQQVLDMIRSSVTYARTLFEDVQFSCEDATRSERNFLVKAINTAIECGASTINIPDTVGYSYPEEMKDLFGFLLSSVKDADKVNFAVHCHNDIGLAVANTLAAVEAGATQAELTVNGIGERAGNAALEEVVMALNVRKDFYLTETNINTRQIYPSSQLLSSITGVKIHPTKPLVGKNAFLHESGIHQHGVLANRATYEIISPESLGIIQNDIVLGKHSGKHAFKDFLEGMDVRVSNEELNILFSRFKEIADKKKYVTYKDISYLITHTNTTQVEKKFSLLNYGITTICGSAMANITLQTKDGVKADTCTGDGPLDAAFKTINRIIGVEFKLEDWSVNAITEGKDAVGAATLRLSYNGAEATGRGISTDTVEASIRAYLNGCNKLLDILGD